MEKKEIDVKFIVGIVILLVIFGVVGGSFWNLVARQAQKDKQEEARLENEAIRAIYVEAGDILKEMVFVDMDKKTVFKAAIPKEGIYNKNDKFRYSPLSAGTSFSFSSSRQAGWVKSPVPTKEIPFFLAHRSRYSGVPCLLVAIE